MLQKCKSKKVCNGGKSRGSRKRETMLLSGSKSKSNSKREREGGGVIISTAVSVK